MAFNQILVVRGICVSRKVMRKIGKIDKSVRGEDLDDLLMENYGDTENFVNDFQLYTWPCCSKMNYKKFIIGKDIARIDIDVMFDKPMEAQPWSTNFELDEALQSLVDECHLSCKPQTFMVPNDCRFCT